MKKSHLLIAASALVLASCAEEIAPVDNNSQVAVGEAPMTFSFRTGNMTRADLQKEASSFGVWGVKTSNAAGITGLTNFTQGENIVMNHYKVEYDAAQTYYDSHWHYESVQGFDNGTTDGTQFLKYWDLGKTHTAFFAYAPFDGTANHPTMSIVGDKARMSFNDYVYMDVAGMDNNFMYAGRLEKNADHANNTAKVPMEFKRLTSKISIGIYEQINGYKVRMIDVKYADDNKTDLGTHGIVSFPITKEGTRGGIVFGGKPYVDFTIPTIEETTEKTAIDGAVGYASPFMGGTQKNEFLEFANPTTHLTDGFISTEGGANASMSTTEYNVIPNNATSVAFPIDFEKNNDGIQLVMNFELVSEDTGEVITVKNARVTVPNKYTQWDANTHYTYIFKITKDTSGTTNPGPDPDPNPQNPGKALYPIVFDTLTIQDLTPAAAGSEGNDHVVTEAPEDDEWIE